MGRLCRFEESGEEGCDRFAVRDLHCVCWICFVIFALETEWYFTVFLV